MQGLGLNEPLEVGLLEREGGSGNPRGAGAVTDSRGAGTSRVGKSPQRNIVTPVTTALE